jgi:hypothetical protein
LVVNYRGNNNCRIVSSTVTFNPFSRVLQTLVYWH